MKFTSYKIWQDALNLSIEIHNLTKRFPTDEKFILTSQIKRAADSVALNIAEGSMCSSDKDFHRHLTYSVKSAMEVYACFYIANGRSYINNSEMNKDLRKLEALIISIQAFRNKLKPSGASYSFRPKA